MGVGIVQNVSIGAVLMKSVEHPTVISPFPGTGVKLAVGKRPRTALAEGIVGFTVQYPPPVQGRHIPATGLDGPSPIDHHGFEAQLHQAQRGKQTRRSGAHDHHRRRGPDIPVGENRPLRGQIFAVAIDTNAQVDPHRSFAGIDRTADDHKAVGGNRTANRPGQGPLDPFRVGCLPGRHV